MFMQLPHLYSCPAQYTLLESGLMQQSPISRENNDIFLGVLNPIEAFIYNLSVLFSGSASKRNKIVLK